MEKCKGAATKGVEKQASVTALTDLGAAESRVLQC